MSCQFIGSITIITSAREREEANNPHGTVSQCRGPLINLLILQSKKNEGSEC